MVDRLAEADLVERRADPADRRAWQLYLTPRAGELLGGMRATADALFSTQPNNYADILGSSPWMSTVPESGSHGSTLPASSPCGAPRTE